MISRSLAAAVLACAGETSRVESPGGPLVAEVHLHQYDLSSHYTASYVRRGVSFDPNKRDQLVNFDPQPAARSGACALYQSHTCTPACAGDREYCAGPNQCTAFRALELIDGGPITVAGGTLIGEVKLAFDSRTGVYRSNVPTSQHAFGGGEKLTLLLAGRTGRMTATVEAPWPIDLTNNTGGLHAVDPLVVQWVKWTGLIRLELTASNKSGQTSSIVCFGEDGGEQRFPADLLARLPPPPRDLRLDYERLQREQVDLGGGRSAVINAGAGRFIEGFD